MIQPAVAILIGGQIKRMPMPRQRPPVGILARQRRRPIALGVRRNVPPIAPPLPDLGVEPHDLGTGRLCQRESIFDRRQNRGVINIAGKGDGTGMNLKRKHGYHLRSLVNSQ